MVVFAVLLPLFCLGFGMALARAFFYKEDGLIQIWMGGVWGLAAFIWLPCLWAFLTNFGIFAQLAAGATAAIGLAATIW